MQESDIRRAFGARLKALRQQRGWTQAEVARQLEVRQPQYNKYEAGTHMPPAENLVRAAELFGVTLDFLLTGGRTEGAPPRDTRLMERLRALEELPPEDVDMVVRLIDVLLLARGGSSKAVPKRRK